MGRRTQAALRQVRQATLAQIEDRFGPALPADLLCKPKAGDHCRERVYPLVRTFWCWVWQVLQANTSCREVVRQLQALFGLHDGPPLDEATGAYCQARRKLPLVLLERIFGATARAVEALATGGGILQSRPLRMVDGSGCRLADTPPNRKAFPPS